MEIELFKGDITKLNVDAIVNAANTSLLGGGGVDGAIHKAAGPQLLQECRNLGGCKTGQAKITKGYLLPAKFVIHTVGPVWSGGGKNENDLLALCYENSFRVAEVYNIKTIAFPNISTGVYGFPKISAAAIALNTVKELAKNSTVIEKVIFAIFDDENYTIYKGLIKNE
jgi:O-acetyl-ADP-ribose deacetylase (regulator of RNase III)